MSKKSTPLSPAELRSKIMRRVKSKDTKIEIMLRKALWHEGIRYRKNYALLPGAPDIAITKHKIAIFCDGEFWHGKDWVETANRLKSNQEFWIAKIERNIQRDNEVDQAIRNMGWIVMRFWGDEIKRELQSCVDSVKDAIFQAHIDSHNIDDGQSIDLLQAIQDEEGKGNEPRQRKLDAG